MSRKHINDPTEHKLRNGIIYIVREKLDWTLQEVADEFNITPERVRQIVQKEKKKAE